MLNLPAKNGGGFLLEKKWKEADTCDFEVEEAVGYHVDVRPGHESLRA